MGLLLYLVGLLALLSGCTKLRRRIRSGVGSSQLAVAEIAIGGAVVIASALGLARSALAPWTVGVTLLIILVSLYEHVVRSMRSRERLLGSESERLERHLSQRAD